MSSPRYLITDSAASKHSDVVPVNYSIKPTNASIINQPIISASLMTLLTYLPRRRDSAAASRTDSHRGSIYRKPNRRRIQATQADDGCLVSPYHTQITFPFRICSHP